MAFLNALADVFRPRPTMQATDTPISAADTTYASMSTTGAVAGGPPPAAGALDTSPQMTAEEYGTQHPGKAAHAPFEQRLAWRQPLPEPDDGHAVAFHYGRAGDELHQVGGLSAITSVLNSICQGAYGFLTPFFSRCKLLGLGNLGIALGTLLSGLAGSYPMLILARGVASVGSSAQHPVGYSILASYFPKNRGTVMALNTSVSNIGTLVATPLATAMLLVMGWRQIFFVVTFASLIMGLVYFFFRDYGAPNRAGSGKSRLAQGFKSYWRVLKNRNMLIIALVFMVGGAGRDGGVNQIYFAPHLKNDFGYDTLTVGILITAISLGGIVGPIIFGWLSDKFSRQRMLQDFPGALLRGFPVGCPSRARRSDAVQQPPALQCLHLVAWDPDAGHRRRCGHGRRPRCRL